MCAQGGGITSIDSELFLTEGTRVSHHDAGKGAGVYAIGHHGLLVLSGHTTAISNNRANVEGGGIQSHQGNDVVILDGASLHSNYGPSRMFLSAC